MRGAGVGIASSGCITPYTLPTVAHPPCCDRLLLAHLGKRHGKEGIDWHSRSLDAESRQNGPTELVSLLRTFTRLIAPPMPPGVHARVY